MVIDDVFVGPTGPVGSVVSLEKLVLDTEDENDVFVGLNGPVGRTVPLE